MNKNSLKLKEFLTLRYLINVALRLFILRQKVAKNDQNLAFLCNKVNKTEIISPNREKRYKVTNKV